MKLLVALVAVAPALALAQIPDAYKPVPMPEQLKSFQPFIGHYEGAIAFSKAALKASGLSKDEIGLMTKSAAPVDLSVGRAISDRFVQIDMTMDPKGGHRLDWRLMVAFDEKQKKLRGWFLQPTPSEEALYEVGDDALEVSKEALTIQNGDSKDNRTILVKTDGGLAFRLESKQGGVWVVMMEGLLHPARKR